ncbi:MAG: SDR family oxidoreductase, partial [Leptospiraceae bacterium]|nr:SDR family oxidoreductase [Leptospiraceae bacterium]
TYLEANEPHAKERKTMLDPSPRVILDSELGLCTAGQNAKAAFIAADIYRHTMDIIERSELLGAYKALSEKDIFDMEYWDLEQAKLRSGIIPPIFSGEVVLITGSASGIGKACIDSFLKRGAAVIGLDLQASVETLYKRPEYIGIACDLTEEEQFKKALQKGVERFGGIDMLVLNAGIFPKSSRIETLSTADWKKTMSINLDANLSILRETYPFLKLSYRGGRVAIVGSKNVPAPGPGAAAYSVSKAALNQLMRVTALEWGQDNIRINSVHPNSVFDTGIWTDEVLKARAEQYGLSVEEYKKNNILKTEIKSKDVAELLAELCGPTFSKTTAAQIPIDGGNDRVL